MAGPQEISEDDANQFIDLIDEVIAHPKVSEAVAKVERLKNQLALARQELRTALKEAVQTPADTSL